MLYVQIEPQDSSFLIAFAVSMDNILPLGHPER